MNLLKTIIMMCGFASFNLYAAWFQTTPLQQSYQAILSQKPDLALQELQLALSQHDINIKYWQSIKDQILTNSQCGQQFTQQHTHLPYQISVSFIRRSGFNSQGYQVKIAVENSPTDLDIRLTSPREKNVLSKVLKPEQSYGEVESDEFLIKPESGLYNLKVNNQSYPLVITMKDSRRWLTLNSQSSDLVIDQPNTLLTCPQPIAYWQWFDKRYQLIGDLIPIQNKDQSYLNLIVPPKAQHLSAMISISEYQGGVKVSYVQRLVIPFTPSGALK